MKWIAAYTEDELWEIEGEWIELLIKHGVTDAEARDILKNDALGLLEEFENKEGCEEIVEQAEQILSDLDAGQLSQESIENIRNNYSGICYYCDTKVLLSDIKHWRSLQ